MSGSGRSSGRRIGLLINPLSGQGRGEVIGRGALARLQGLGHHVSVFDHSDIARTVAAVKHGMAAGEDGIDVLVAVGGDGGVNLAVNLLAGSDMPLGVIPSGTGNDIARSWRLPQDPVAAIDTIDACLRSNTSWDVDVVAMSTPGDVRVDTVDLAATRHTFAGVMATGFDAAVSERANRWRWPTGPARYNVAIARELPTYRARQYRLDLDGQTWDVRALLVSIANTATYGGGMRIAPAASVSDGLVDVVVVRPVSLIRFVRLFPKVYAGTHVDLPDVEVRRAKRVTVTTIDERPAVIAYADGERIGPLPVTLEVKPGALRVLARPAPAGTPVP